ncbi:MAG: MoaA/NifB/PqqE/SkfB family radical SAM enzyme [Psychromonas sp.]|jgi:MoaA/NifB/PqqE/SkfB family radical SAM enzyme
MFIPSNMTIMTTDFCTAKCSHCLVSSSPTRKAKLKNSQMIAAIDSIHELGGLQVVVFAGGEPTALGGHLLDAIAYANDKNIATRVVTNSSWATTPEAATDLVTI